MSVEALDFLQLLELYQKNNHIPKQLTRILLDFYRSYAPSLQQNGYSVEACNELLITFLDKLVDHLRSPYSFPIYHKAIREPFDYFNFSLDFIRPLIKLDKSKVLGVNHLDRIETGLRNGENAIFLANHQTEPDAQIIGILLQKNWPQLIENLIYVAGHRVLNDPMAIPMSMGCNLLCIWSKRHMEHPPEEKSAKLEHNRRTLKMTQKLLNEGGKAIYVAPSGGRDRPSQEGILEVAPFDPAAVELFMLCARQATRPTRIYPMALGTYDLMPPPDQVLKELGEPRYTKLSPVHISVGPEIDTESLIHLTPHGDRWQQREWRAKQVWNLVRELYHKL